MDGQLNEAQRDALREAISGRLVHDLGAGDLRLAHELLAQGAAGVIAVDRHPMPVLRDARIRTLVSYFDDVDASAIATAFLSWPVNWPCGLGDLIAGAERIVYLGKNTDGAMCGSYDMWVQLFGREVLAYVPDRRNTLIVYGRALRPQHQLDKAYPEERAAATINERLWRYEESMTAFSHGRWW